MMYGMEQPDLTLSFYAALGLTLAGAALLYHLLLRRRGLSAWAAWITLGLGLPLAFLCAKLGFLLSAVDRLFLGMFDTLWADAKDLAPTAFSFTGGCAGFAVAAVLAAKILRRKAGAYLDVFAVPFCAAIACVRLAERFLETVNLGDPVEAAWLRVFPVATPDSWGDWTLCLSWICAAAALVCLFLSLRPRWQKAGVPGLCFERTAFWLCALQLLPELMRADPIKLSQYFVRTEQVLCGIAMLFLLIRGGVRLRRAGKGGLFRTVLLPVIIFLALVGAHILLQFVLDKPYKFLGGLPESAQIWCAEHLKLLCYLPMALATAGMILLHAFQTRAALRVSEEPAPQERPVLDAEAHPHLSEDEPEEAAEPQPDEEPDDGPAAEPAEEPKKAKKAGKSGEDKKAGKDPQEKKDKKEKKEKKDKKGSKKGGKAKKDR